MRKIWKTLPVAAFIVTGIFIADAQKAPEKNWSSAKILHEIEKMRHVGRVLYIAAHPDDENTQLISYLVNVKGIETAYLSLTRGDGGQNLLGPEVREELGIIRTQELLMARAADGGQQFFSRANDFGFSKTAFETFHIWDRDDVLADIVWAIRKFKPDIIITRFSPTYTKTHGHHQASAILAQEAFTAAADSSRYPEQLKYVSPWQTEAIFWNTSTFFFQDNKFDTTGLYHINIGSYMPLLGKSVGEIAAESRSMHKSQGFGSSARRGDIMEYFVYLQGLKPTGKDILTDVYDSWDRVKGCEDVAELLEDIVARFDAENPAGSIKRLASLYNHLSHHADNYLVASKLKALGDIILQCAGVYAEAISDKEFIPVGDSIKVTLNSYVQSPEVINNGDIGSSLIIEGLPVQKGIIPSVPRLLNQDEKTQISTAIPPGKFAAYIPDSTTITGPYWLEQEPTVGMYEVDDQKMRGLPQNPPQVKIHMTYNFGCTIERDIPVFFKNVDPVKGEQYSLVHIVPPAVANPQNKLMVFSTGLSKELKINLKSFTKGTARVKLNAPVGWTVTPAFDDADMKGNGSEQALSFNVTPGANAKTADIDIEIETGGHTYNRSSEVISYDHIPTQLLLPKSRVKAVRIADIKIYNRLIGYIAGAGDQIPDMLRQVGYRVEMIPAEQLATIDLNKYDCIIAGVRAYNTVPQLKYNNRRLMDYVKDGGNYIVQYNNNFRLVTDSIGPYMLHPSNTRTTEEDCKITFLNKDNPVLNNPNKITEADFEGWVQERGLYYPDKWDSTHYVPVLEMADNGEKPTDGALLVTQYGKGYFTYTGLSFFRELPAGVPGAYRLFANLVELGRSEK